MNFSKHELPDGIKDRVCSLIEDMGKIRLSEPLEKTKCCIKKSIRCSNLNLESQIINLSESLQELAFEYQFFEKKSEEKNYIFFIENSDKLIKNVKRIIKIIDQIRSSSFKKKHTLDFKGSYLYYKCWMNEIEEIEEFALTIEYNFLISGLNLIGCEKYSRKLISLLDNRKTKSIIYKKIEIYQHLYLDYFYLLEEYNDVKHTRDRYSIESEKMHYKLIKYAFKFTKSLKTLKIDPADVYSEVLGVRDSVKGFLKEYFKSKMFIVHCEIINNLINFITIIFKIIYQFLNEETGLVKYLIILKHIMKILRFLKQLTPENCLISRLNCYALEIQSCLSDCLDGNHDAPQLDLSTYDKIIMDISTVLNSEIESKTIWNNFPTFKSLMRISKIRNRFDKANFFKQCEEYLNNYESSNDAIFKFSRIAQIIEIYDILLYLYSLNHILVRKSYEIILDYIKLISSYQIDEEFIIRL